MTREEKIDWLCRLRSWVGTPPRMTVGQVSKIVEALTETIEDLETQLKKSQELSDAIIMLKRELISINVMLEENDDFDNAQLAHDKILHEKLISLLEQIKGGN